MVDVMAIIFSVLFALALDDWRERRDIRAKVENVLHTIALEIDQNKKEVADALAYHNPLVDSLRNGTHRISSMGLKGRFDPIRNVNDLEDVLNQVMRNNRSMMFKEVQVRQTNAGNYYAKIGDRTYRVQVSADSMQIYGEGNIQLRPARIHNSAWETAIATQTTIHLDFDLVAAMTELTRLHEIHDDTVERIINMLYSGEGSITDAMQDLRWFEQSLLEKYAQVQAILDD